MEGSKYKCEQWGVLHPHPAEDRSWGGPPPPSQCYTCASRAAPEPEEKRGKTKSVKSEIWFILSSQTISHHLESTVKTTMYTTSNNLGQKNCQTIYSNLLSQTRCTHLFNVVSELLFSKTQVCIHWLQERNMSCKNLYKKRIRYVLVFP